MKPVLTEKQKRFIDYYIETGNATEAAKKAGYSRKTAKAAGYENLTKPYLKSAIDERLKALEEKRVADAREVLIHLTAALRGEIEEEVIVCEGVGEGVSKARTIKKHLSARDRLKAAELLMRRYGLAMSDIEQEEKKAKTAALNRGGEEDNGEEVTILDDTGTDPAE